MTLFVLATRDGWVTVMHYGVDAVDVDYQVKLTLLTLGVATGKL